MIDNRTLVLLHGFCESSELWRSFIPLLNAEFHVVTIDLPGFGSNQVEVSSLDEMGDDVIRQMDNLNLTKVCIIGHSLGGYVALNVAKKDKNRIVGLGFFHSNALADSAEKKEQRAKSAQHVAEYGTDQFLKAMAVSLLSETNSKNEKLLTTAHNLIKNAPQKGILNALSAMSNRNEELEFLSKTSIPILWMIGRHDTFMKVDSQLQQASLCRKTMIHILENTGHLGMIESPEEAAEIINQFTDWSFS